MHTKDKLAEALRAAGLAEMSVRAAEGYYHDYLSPLATPELQLVADLEEAGTPAAMELRARVVDGEFDATEEEGDEWAASPEGQEAMRAVGRKS